MNHDLLDREARLAADAIHREVADVDVDAALAAVLAGPDLRPRRRLAAAAAAVVLLGGVAVAVSQQGSDPQRVGTADAPPLDPSDYGPVLQRLRGLDDPTLQATIHGPELLDDRDELAVAISGGRPGQRYLLQQCVVAGPDVNPAASCTFGPDFVLDADGAGIGVVEVSTVFDGVGWPHRNDCRIEACELVISGLVEEDQPDEGLPGTQFDDPNDAEVTPWPQLRFAPDAGAPPLPAMEAEVLDDGAGTTSVRITGRDLPAGAIVELRAHGFTVEPSGFLASSGGIGSEEIATVEVAADGTFSTDATLPAQVTEEGERIENGVVQSPEVVTCADAAWSCQIRLTYEDGPPLVDGRPALVAPQLPYPAT